MREQRLLDMTLEKFHTYIVPEGWKLIHVIGHNQYGWPGSLDSYFNMSVTIEKEKSDAIL